MLPSEILKQPLRQDKPAQLNIEFDKAWEFVEQNCTDALAAYKKTPRVLFRGVKKRHRRFFSASLEIIGE